MTSDLTNLRSYKELRAAAREQLKGNWGKAILVYFIFSIIMGLPGAIPAVGVVAMILLMGPLQYGMTKFYIRICRHEEADIETLFDGFKAYTKTMVLGLLIWLFTFLWSLLAVIPILAFVFLYLPFNYGNVDPTIVIIAAAFAILLLIPAITATLRYSQAYFIMLDNQGMEAMDAIRASKTMMKGHKGRLFVLCLTFIGWAILAMIPLCLGFFVLMPYIEMSFANFYTDLKAANTVVEPVITPSDEQ